MKLYVYFLAFVLAFIVPINAYAIFPALAGAGSVAGRFLLAGAIKKLAPQGMKGLVKGAVGYCLKNKLACVLTAEKIYDIFDDDDITINNEGDTVNIYKTENTTVCYSATHFTKTPLRSSPEQVCSDLLGKKNTSAGLYISKSTYVYENNQHRCAIENSYIDGSGGKATGYDIISKENCNLTNKVYLSDDEIYNTVINKLSDDDITAIYNYDFSKETEITINNQKYSGDTINNYKNDFDESETKHISENARNNIINKKKDYDVDEVNETNCSKDKNGRLDKCGSDRDSDDDTASSSTDNTKIDIDDDDTTNNNSDDDTTNNNSPDEEDPPPIECNANGFYKKVCDWMDWTQKDYEKPKKSEIEVEDKSDDLPQLKQDRVNFSEQCPPPKKFSISALGVTKELEISYQQYCDFFIAFRPFSTPLATFGAILIIAGVGRKDG